MQEFTISPFTGTIPLLFGMTPASVATILGPPTWSFRNHAGVLIEGRPDLNVNVGYTASDELNETVFAEGSVLKYEEKNLFENRDPVSIIMQRNTGFIWLGSYVFPSIGVLCTKIEKDDDEYEWTITVATHGLWDDYKEDFVIYNPLSN